MDENIKINGLVKHVIENGGIIKPLLIDPELTKGTGLMNPSVFIHGDRILVNIRHINYTLYHSEQKKFPHQWGPLQYLHPENDMTLTTVNYLAQLDDDLNMTKVTRVDTSAADKPPIWHFIGLEDARLFSWYDKLYLCGVRRDTTPNGQGRMDLVEIMVTENLDIVREVSRTRIPTTGNDDSYCEKNWMPIADIPLHWVKWTNPTEVVRYDTDSKKTVTMYLDESKYITGLPDFRGSSQVIRYQNYWMALTHETFLYNSELGRKDGHYRHRFIIWDKDWNIVKMSESFSFMNGDIEFCCGAAFHGNDLLLSFGFQDNCAYIMRIPEKVFREFVGL